MAPTPDDPPIHPPDHEAGGPVKSFLEHLEDLRWVLVKSAVALSVGMLVCLGAGPQIVAFLKYPLNHPLSIFRPDPDKQLVPLHLGTNYIGSLPRGQIPLAQADTNELISFALTPRVVNGEIMLALVQDPSTNTFAPPGKTPDIGSLGPFEAVMVSLKVSLWGGIVLAAPFIIFFLGGFILPALHVHERKMLYQSVGWSAGLFLTGVAFCYLIVLSVALMASASFSRYLGFSADLWRAEEYLDFVVKFMVGMGLCFQIPVIILVLVKIGLLDYQKLNQWRGYVFVANLIVAAFITPTGDPLSLMLFGLPLQLLYELSVLIAWWWARKERKPLAKAGASAEAK